MWFTGLHMPVNHNHKTMGCLRAAFRKPVGDKIPWIRGGGGGGGGGGSSPQFTSENLYNIDQIMKQQVMFIELGIVKLNLCPIQLVLADGSLFCSCCINFVKRFFSLLAAFGDLEEQCYGLIHTKFVIYS